MSTANTVLVGKKPLTNYVLAALTLIQGGSDSVVVKARGRAISKAVDVAQILMKKYIPELKVKDIRIDTEQVKSPETGNVANVSSIEIVLGR